MTDDQQSKRTSVLKYPVSPRLAASRTAKGRTELVDDMFQRDPKLAFDHALATGKLSVDLMSDTFVGDYMYMYSTPGLDHFKQRITRVYLEVKVS